MSYADRTIETELLEEQPARVERKTGWEGLDRFKSGSRARGRPVDCADPHLGPLLSILFTLIDETRSVVVNVTGAHAGAGASTVARRLAAAAAASGWCRVALIDAEPVPAEVEQGDGSGLDWAGRDQAGRARASWGLVEQVEQGEAPLLTPRRVGAVEIDMGRLGTAGQALTRIGSVRRLYGVLRDRYTLVIVDCPAVLSGQQTLIVAAAADETVLVVEAERTPMADVARARAALERRGAGVLGMVMNKSRRGPRRMRQTP